MTSLLVKTCLPFTETETKNTTGIPLSSTSTLYLSIQHFKKRTTIQKTQETNINPDQHRILIPKGMNCKLQYPVDYDYARGMLIMHKVWHKNMTLKGLLKKQTKHNQ
jgi:hypothetical protein